MVFVGCMLLQYTYRVNVSISVQRLCYKNDIFCDDAANYEVFDHVFEEKV